MVVANMIKIEVQEVELKVGQLFRGGWNGGLYMLITQGGLYNLYNLNTHCYWTSPATLEEIKQELEAKENEFRYVGEFDISKLGV